MADRRPLWSEGGGPAPAGEDLPIVWDHDSNVDVDLVVLESVVGAQTSQRWPVTVVRGSADWWRLVAYCSLVAAVLLILPIFALPTIEGRIFTQVVATTVVLWGLDLQLGLSGQLSLGHGAFVGVGAYTTAILFGRFGVPFLVTLPIAALFGFCVGVVAGLPALRIRGQYLAAVTVGLAIAFPSLVKRYSWFTGGANGPRVNARIYPPDWLGLNADRRHVWVHLVIVACAAVMFVVVRSIIRGPTGRVIRAVGDDETASTAFGIRVGVVRNGTVGLSAAVGAVGGGLLFFESMSVSADSYDVFRSLTYFAAAVFGGMGAMSGGFFGALLVVVAPYLTFKLGLTVNSSLIAGVALVGATLSSPGGMARALTPSVDRWVLIEEARPGSPRT